jgi:steroid delta-isomerase-like uncharacterized protein
MSTDRNKQVMRRIYDEMVSGHDLDLLDEFFAEDVRENEELGGGHGRAGLRSFFTMLFTAFPDYRAEIEDLVAEGDRVVARITGSGTHLAEFLGVPATGVRVAVPGIDIMRFRDGQVIEHWGVTDALGLLKQLAALPPVTRAALETFGGPGE